MKNYDKDPFVVGVRLERERVASFETYPFCIPAVRGLEELAIDPGVTFLVGENGSGKSTLLEGIAVALGFNAEGGSKNFSFSTRASHSELYRYLKVDRGRNLRKPRDGFFFRAESYFNLATEIEKLDSVVPVTGQVPAVAGAYGGGSLHEMSHGESFFVFLNNRLRGDGLYVMDEPEAALSPTRQMSMLTIMHELVKKGSQLIIATHSPILMGYPGATIYLFSEEGVKQVEYEETEHFRVTSAFLNKRRKMLDILLNGGQGELF